MDCTKRDSVIFACNMLTTFIEYSPCLTELNLRAVKSTLSENQVITRMALSAKDPQELFALQARRAQAAMEEAQSY